MLKPRKNQSNQVVLVEIAKLKPFPDNPRSHPSKQILLLAKSISKLGLSRPIGIDEQSTILVGHGCVEAVKSLGWTHVPAWVISGLSEPEKRAMVIADNHLASKSEWDNSALKIQLSELFKLDFDVALTGFSMAEIDLQLAVSDPRSPANEPADDIPLAAKPISREGDVWNLGRHRIVCGNALTAPPFHALLGKDIAEMVFTDPPYNVKIWGHARGRSKQKHREFAMASGEMSKPGFTGFLEDAMNRAIQFSEGGSIHYWCMDWRHMPELLRAGLPLYSDWKNLLVWRKSNAGQGSFYRSQHELIAVFKSGKGRHINNFGLGSDGRYRTNVLDYPGGASPDPKRKEELEIHPTVKPMALVADLMRDCSKRNGIILDLFGGSGTTILAAEETGRKARLVELDPLYVDLSIRRWQKQTSEKAIHEPSGKSFDVLAKGAPRHG